MKPIFLIWVLSISITFGGEVAFESGNPKYVIHNKTAAIFNHNSTVDGDVDKTTRQGTQTLIHSMRRNGVFSALIASRKSSEYFLSSNEANLTVQSTYGYHRIYFEEADALIFSGGYLTLCLCKAINSAIEQAGAKELTVFLVTDAIYKSNTETEKAKGLKDTHNLAEYIRSVGHDRFERYLEQTSFGGSCLGPFGQRDLKLDEKYSAILRHGDRRLKLIFINQKDLSHELNLR